MKFSMRNKVSETTQNFAGQLLVAHPGLLDPNFQKAVILLSAHDTEDGSLGVILNRPLGKTLSQINTEFSYGPLAAIPVYEGGPVKQQEVILTAWYWEPESSTFRLYFGIDENAVRELQMMHPDAEFRAFHGYSGWSGGQLEQELTEEAWVLSPLQKQSLQSADGDQFWKRLITGIDPELGFLADMPDDPSLN